MKAKTLVTYGFSLVFFLGLLFVFFQVFQEVPTPVTPTESFSQALWGTWGATILIVSFILFAGGAGILVLLGGGWRWE
ncbi:MAG: hypothetical protein H6P94_708 [Thermoplasmatales archaeon]|jgi:hypothetical protein|nr:hypothetical protein [Thermoplasmatales archaeon]